MATVIKPDVIRQPGLAAATAQTPGLLLQVHRMKQREALMELERQKHEFEVEKQRRELLRAQMLGTILSTMDQPKLSAAPEPSYEEVMEGFRGAEGAGLSMPEAEARMMGGGEISGGELDVLKGTGGPLQETPPTARDYDEYLRMIGETGMLGTPEGNAATKQILAAKEEARVNELAPRLEQQIGLEPGTLAGYGTVKDLTTAASEATEGWTTQTGYDSSGREIKFRVNQKTGETQQLKGLGRKPLASPVFTTIPSAGAIPGTTMEQKGWMFPDGRFIAAGDSIMKAGDFDEYTIPDPEAEGGVRSVMLTDEGVAEYKAQGIEPSEVDDGYSTSVTAFDSAGNPLHFEVARQKGAGRAAGKHEEGAKAKVKEQYILGQNLSRKLGNIIASEAAGTPSAEAGTLSQLITGFSSQWNQMAKVAGGNIPFKTGEAAEKFINSKLPVGTLAAAAAEVGANKAEFAGAVYTYAKVLKRGGMGERSAHPSSTDLKNATDALKQGYRDPAQRAVIFERIMKGVADDLETRLSLIDDPGFTYDRSLLMDPVTMSKAPLEEIGSLIRLGPDTFRVSTGGGE